MCVLIIINSGNGQMPTIPGMPVTTPINIPGMPPITGQLICIFLLL